MYRVVKKPIFEQFPIVSYSFYSAEDLLKWANKHLWGGFNSFEDCVSTLNAFGYEVINIGGSYV